MDQPNTSFLAEDLVRAADPDAGDAREDSALNALLEGIYREKKTDYLFELEMWIIGFERFFRIKNHPLTDYEIAELLNKDFAEELWVVQSVASRVSFLCTEILTRERHHLLQFERYVENELKKDFVLDAFLEKMMGRPSPEDSITLLVDALADIRTVIGDIGRGAHVSYQAFTAIGRLLLREVKRCSFIELLLNLKYKTHSDKIHNRRLAQIVLSIPCDQVRQGVAKVVLSLYRLLNCLKYVENDLAQNRPLKNSLMIFVLLRSEMNLLAEYLENKVMLDPWLPATLHERIDAILYAMRMEMKKVFSHELVGMIYQRHAQQVFVKVENSHGLLRDCLQNAIVQIVQAFEPEFDGNELFHNLKARLTESLRLKEDLAILVHYVKIFQEKRKTADPADLIDTLQHFREVSLRFLMYRDWDDYEKFMEEISIASGRAEMADVLHRFEIFLKTLLGEVGKRSVLLNFRLGEIESPERELGN